MTLPKVHYVNLGCGERFHPDWINIDMVAREPGVIAHDLSKSIPLPDNHADVVYHTAVLEHIRRPDALKFIKECYRVLKPGGIIRVGVPDLERITLLYLEKLNAAVEGNPSAADDYEWMMLEMCDQLVREQGGGHMLDYLQRNPLPGEQFIYQRIGQEGRTIVESVRASAARSRPTRGFGWMLYRGLRILAREARDGVLKLLFGPNAPRAMRVGLFRVSGEAHQWMYDRYSLSRILIAAGFTNLALRTPTESAVPRWAEYQLDTLPDGTVNKPDLLFMEAIKP